MNLSKLLAFVLVVATQAVNELIPLVDDEVGVREYKQWYKSEPSVWQKAEKVKSLLDSDKFHFLLDLERNSSPDLDLGYKEEKMPLFHFFAESSEETARIVLHHKKFDIDWINSSNIPFLTFKKAKEFMSRHRWFSEGSGESSYAFINQELCTHFGIFKQIELEDVRITPLQFFVLSYLQEYNNGLMRVLLADSRIDVCATAENGYTVFDMIAAISLSSERITMKFVTRSLVTIQMVHKKMFTQKMPSQVQTGTVLRAKPFDYWICNVFKCAAFPGGSEQLKTDLRAYVQWQVGVRFRKYSTPKLQDTMPHLPLHIRRKVFEFIARPSTIKFLFRPSQLQVDSDFCYQKKHFAKVDGYVTRWARKTKGSPSLYNLNPNVEGAVTKTFLQNLSSMPLGRCMPQDASPEGGTFAMLLGTE